MQDLCLSLSGSANEAVLPASNLIGFSAVFKKDTKEKNQKKAEAKKRKAEQQEQQQQQQEPGVDDMADMHQGDPDSALASDLQPAETEVQLSSEQRLMQQSHPALPMQSSDVTHQPPMQHTEHADDKRQKQSEAEPADQPMTDVPQQQSVTVPHAPQEQALSGQPPQAAMPAPLPSAHQQADTAPATLL